MKTYAVRVFKQGVQRGSAFRIPAPCALEAMNEVEERLGLKKPEMSIDKSTGKMFALWHGYEFKARALQ